MVIQGTVASLYLTSFKLEAGMLALARSPFGEYTVKHAVFINCPGSGNWKQLGGMSQSVRLGGVHDVCHLLFSLQRTLEGGRERS